ncbi:MAG: cytochrome [Bacteroidetes bacterium]|nr:cytochrome [Bacteroidota bacterium]
MKKLFILSVGLLSMTILLSECKTSKTTTTTTKDEKPAPTSADMADIASGQLLFTTKCDKCHKQPGIHKHDITGWGETMGKMGPKAQLSDAETVQVLKYLASENK